MPGSGGFLRALREAAEVLALTVAAALALRTFVIDAVRVPSASMANTILAGDFLLVDRLVYRVRAPHRGEVIVFAAPDAGGGVRYVKRIAGLPGDTLRMRQGVLSVDGREVLLPPTAKVQGGLPPDFGPVGVPAGTCFVLGDNLEESLDSRAWGFVPMPSVTGRAMMVYWSISPGGIRWNRILTIIR
ncbi:MAG TPA: signal peptidase I [Bacteroidota bacterium]|nr:signal peptidase I [Bacteroidota bacterium]